MRCFDLEIRQEKLRLCYAIIHAEEELLKTLRGIYRDFEMCRENILKAIPFIKDEIKQNELEIKEIRSGIDKVKRLTEGIG